MSGIQKYGEVVPDHGFGFIAMTVLTIVTGTLLLMWIGDQITERGLGNGISPVSYTHLRAHET